MKTTKIDINFQETYQIYIGYNLLIKNHLIDIYRKYAKRVAIIADKNVSELYGKPLFNLFKKKQIKVNLLSFVSSEKNKSRMSKEILENKMLRLGCGRDTMLIAVGGGITTDIAGFIAATYCRGIPVVYIPTSLLAMVDASIGGKTGVNTLFGKNLIGVFYQPKSVIIDIDTLKTLPIDEFKSGIVEIIKHALIKDVKLFDFLELNAKKINGLDRNILMQAISKSCKIKKEIIEQDEKDYGIRQLLNFGHTIGHALEKVTNYKVSHGKAVALGIVVESFISMRLGYLSKNSFERIIHSPLNG